MLDVDSGNGSANLYFSNFYSDDEPAKARQYMIRLINSNPPKAGFYRKMGDLFRRENKKDSAFVYYEQAFRLSVQDQYLKNDYAAKKYYSKYLLFAKPQSIDEKKAYNYIRKKYLKEK